MNRPLLRRTNGFALLFITLLVGCDANKPVLTGSGPAGSAKGTTPAAATLTIAAASDLKFALDEMLVDFRKQHPEWTVQVTYGSSGNFFAQLQQQAPFDLYLSADLDYVRKLGEAGKTVPGSDFKYAEGRVVVWVRNESKLDVTGDGTAALKDTKVKKIAVANPQHAPYGRAAVAALKHYNLYESLESKLVYGENIAQTSQFVESGAADIGIIALSLAIAPAMKDQGRYAVIPADAHPKLEQGGAILNWAKDRGAAESLRTFITGAAGRAVLQRYGFITSWE